MFSTRIPHGRVITAVLSTAYGWVLRQANFFSTPPQRPNPTGKARLTRPFGLLLLGPPDVPHFLLENQYVRKREDEEEGGGQEEEGGRRGREWEEEEEEGNDEDEEDEE